MARSYWPTRLYAGGMVIAPLWSGFMGVLAAQELLVVGALIPLQGGNIGSALCNLGIGTIITAALYLAALALAYLAIGDFFSGFANRRSKSSDRKGQAGSDFGSGGFKLVGAVVIGGFPLLANAIGFSLLSCVSPIRILTG